MWARPGLRERLGVALVLLACRQPAGDQAGKRQVAEGLILGREWVEVAVDPPLEARGRWPELILHHSPELTLTRAVATNAVYSPKLDQLIRLDVELLGKDGAVLRLGSGGLSPGRIAMKPLAPELPPDFVVERLRLRSSSPIEVAKLEWFGARRP